MNYLDAEIVLAIVTSIDVLEETDQLCLVQILSLDHLRRRRPPMCMGYRRHDASTYVAETA
jgi:hypothetical protein